MLKINAVKKINART